MNWIYSYNIFMTIKWIHISFVIFWMAGMLYLPRLFVYHSRTTPNSESCQMLQIMERKLIRFIMNPGIIVVFFTGAYLFVANGGIHGPTWMHAKWTFALILGGMHGFLSKCRKMFAQGLRPYSEKFFRLINEIPSIITLIMVFLAVFRP